MGSKQPVMEEQRIALSLACSAASVGLATACTNPIDVVKVRLQLAKRSLGTTRPGLISTATSVIQTEGARVLARGLPAALVRAGTYGGMRLGLYSPCKSLFDVDPERPSLVKKIAAGCLSGTIAALISNPTDLVKVRLQMKTAPGRAEYGGVLDVVRAVIREQGVLGLWKGSVPSMARAATLTASQCATYDEVKRAAMRGLGMKDDMRTHLVASMATGLVTTTVTSPVDVLKTTMFAREGCSRGPVEVAAMVVRAEGVRGLFKGWSANYARLGPQTAITFVAFEKLRALCGLGGV